MNLLILTQKVSENDDVLGFMCGWIKEFAANAKSVTVICLEKRDYVLPQNVRIFSLGKEKNLKEGVSGAWDRLRYLLNFYRLIWQERRNYDAVFVHMDHIYVLLGGFFWRFWGKKIAMWYAHGHVSSTLSWAEKLAHIVFTSTASGFRLASKKLYIVGQGIDMGRFRCETREAREDGLLKIISIGRISPVKDYKTLIEAVRILTSEGIKLGVKIIGKPPAGEDAYLQELRGKITEYKLGDNFEFLGGIPNMSISKYLCASDIFVNMSYTGSLDKAILEAMAAEVPVLTCNEALLDVLREYKNVLMYKKGDFKELAEKIKGIYQMTREDRSKLGVGLRDIVERDHGLARLITKIIYVFQNN